MKKSLLLFFLLVVSIILLKVSESDNTPDVDNSTVEELVLETNDKQIAEK